MGLYKANKNIDRNFQMYPGVTAGLGLLSDMRSEESLRASLGRQARVQPKGFWDTATLGKTLQECLHPDPEIVKQILEFEKLSPVSTKQRLHRYILRNYTPEGRRIIYHRTKSRPAEPVDKRRKLTPEQVDEMRRLKTQGMSYRQLAKRFGVRSPSTILKIIHGLCWKNRADEIISL